MMAELSSELLRRRMLGHLKLYLQHFNPANAPQNTSDVAPGNDAASTELQPDATPAPEAEWSGRHTAILLIAITLSLFAGYALAFLYRRLAEGKKARMMDEAPASPPGGAPRAEAAAEPSRA